MDKKIIYVDMDGVLVDIEREIYQLYDKNIIKNRIGDIIDTHPHIFKNAQPIPGAISSFKKLRKDPRFDVYILSTAPWSNINAWSQKRIWIEKYLGESGMKRLILSHHKNLLKGDILIDDRLKNGVQDFEGLHIHFGTNKYPDWEHVLDSIEKLN